MQVGTCVPEGVASNLYLPLFISFLRACSVISSRVGLVSPLPGLPGAWHDNGERLKGDEVLMMGGLELDGVPGAAPPTKVPALVQVADEELRLSCDRRGDSKPSVASRASCTAE